MSGQDAHQQLLCREAAMRDVLRQLTDKSSLCDLSQDDMRLAKDCYAAGYIEGIVFLEMISGRIVAEYRHEPRLTREGLAFLAEDTEDPAANDDQENDCFHKKILQTVCMFFERIKPPAKIAWGLFAGFSVIVTVFGWPQILRFLAFLRSLF